jgi:hypothetical protein
VEAFGIYGSPNSLSVLMDILRVKNPPPYLKDEVVLAMTAILDTQNQFYTILTRYLDDPSLVTALAMDEAESAQEFYKAAALKAGRKKPPTRLAKHAELLPPAAAALFRENNGAPLSRWILELPGDLCHSVAQTVLSETLLDDELSALDRLRLLIVHWAAHELRLWTKRMK